MRMHKDHSPRLAGFTPKTLTPSPKGLATSVFALLLLGGCATQEPLVPTQQALSDASKAALSHAIRLNSLVRDCRRLGGDIAAYADNTQQQWLSRNWQWVAAADADYSLQLAPQTSQYNGKAIAPEALRFLATTEAEAERSIGFKKRSPKNRQSICSKHLSFYEDSNNDLTSGPHGAAYRYLNQRFDNLPANPQPVPALAADLDPRSAPGRSLFEIEKQATDNNCGQVNIYTFRNQWPHEAYGVFCQNQPGYLVTCEWGRCQQESLSAENPTANKP